MLPTPYEEMIADGVLMDDPEFYIAIKRRAGIGPTLPFILMTSVSEIIDEKAPMIPVVDVSGYKDCIDPRWYDEADKVRNNLRSYNE